MNLIAEAVRPTAAHLVPSAPVFTVRMMQHADVEKWDKFVLACPHTSFFHRAGWKHVIERAFGHRTYFLYVECEGRIQGVLPLAQIKSLLFGHSLSSLPFCVYGGIAASSPAAADALDRAAQKLAEKLNVDYLEYRHHHPQHPEWPTKSLYVTFRKDIYADDEKNMLAIPRKQRAMVRKGIKANLQSSIDRSVNRFFAAYSASVHRLGTPVFSKKYFRLLKETFAENCEILTITKEGRTISSVMSFYFRDEVLPYYGGGTAEARDVAGNDFMYWELMRYAVKKGIRVFDFGRSKQGTGAFDFKKNWGFEPQPLHYEYQLRRAQSIPDTNPLNPKYQLMIKVWQRLPLCVANVIGPHIVKNLG
ncbi:FemAB family PEP-CTERM system-associated protein [Glaciimonas sp. Gout2]|uniref:FemAB family XrtA/PEP-CTERM system-associated protein n=2 Tax=Glaciimonas TaxID=1229970 RepID=UPI002B2251D5|nr:MULTISPECIES: FemAB family XrtA/PEP-CTERM system-associated protein [unclassified Glaciimonas]MEB0012015.1 FemAB family PEP-CTERM system-associated protein [Glaciimonas sp. Cout2]MEB0084069.1 FemAB family PEP-CTERM system-associated protein [Glaciimonas sp. Gout2]